MSIRIAYLMNRYGAGGLERCVAHLINGLDQQNFTPLIISFRSFSEIPDWIDRDDEVPVCSANKKAGNDLGLVFRLARMFRANQISIAQSHNWATLVETSIACRIAGVVHVHAEHGQQQRSSLTNRGLRRWLHGKARINAFRRCGAVIACAESVRSGIQSQWGFPKDRVVFIPNGVKQLHQQNQCLRDELGLRKSAFVVGSVGRLFGLKRFDILIQAVHKLVEDQIDAHLVLVGDGPEESKLRELVTTLGLSENVHMVGFKENVGDWLSAFDVFANSSDTEAMSMSILEAMSIGCPIVATDVGDSRLLVEKDVASGIVVPPSTHDSMAMALRQYAENGELRKIHGTASLDKFNRHYSVDSMVQNYKRLYEDIACRKLGAR